jgi:hypothetical protein
MSPLRFAATTAAAAILVAAAVLSSSCSGPEIPDCAIPSPSELGVDGGTDPCHCAPPPSLNITACPCLSGNQADVDVYNTCMFVYRGEMDAGAE